MASKYLQKFPIPQGFNEILNDLTKEILRYQPENIVEFSALYFKCLQEGKELDYQKKGQNIPCDFKNVIPGSKNIDIEKPIDKSNYDIAKEKSMNLLMQTPTNADQISQTKSKPTMTAATRKVAERLKNGGKTANIEEVQVAPSIKKIEATIKDDRLNSGNPEKIKRITNDYVNELMSKSKNEDELP